MKILFLNGDVVFGIHPNHEETENYEHVPHVLYEGEAEIKPGYLTVWTGKEVEYRVHSEIALPTSDERIAQLEEENALLKSRMVITEGAVNELVDLVLGGV